MAQKKEYSRKQSMQQKIDKRDCQVLSVILQVMEGRGEEYRNCRRMAINIKVQKVCMEEGVGFVYG